MSAPLCQRLGDAGFEQCALLIEAVAEADPIIHTGDAMLELEEISTLLVEAQEVVSRIKAGTLTRDEAAAMCVQPSLAEEFIDELKTMIDQCPPTQRGES